MAQVGDPRSSFNADQVQVLSVAFDHALGVLELPETDADHAGLAEVVHEAGKKRLAARLTVATERDAVDIGLQAVEDYRYFFLNPLSDGDQELAVPSP